MRGQKVEVDIPRGEIAAFCERHHIRKLAVFGSVLRDDLRADSRASIKRNSN
jgi:predicted nucleotidyltransferase